MRAEPMQREPSTENHGRVRIMPAGMHDTGRLGSIGILPHFGDRQRVEVCADCDACITRPLLAFHQCDGPRTRCIGCELAHTVAHNDTFSAQPIDHVTNSVQLVERKLRMLVQVSAPSDHVGAEIRDGGLDAVDHNIPACSGVLMRRCPTG